jgi:hypothetical protein
MAQFGILIVFTYGLSTIPNAVDALASSNPTTRTLHGVHGGRWESFLTAAVEVFKREQVHQFLTSQWKELHMAGLVDK